MRYICINKKFLFETGKGRCVIMTLNDYKIKLHTFRTAPTGSYEITRNGKRRAVIKGHSFILTEKHGELPEEEWISQVKDCIIQEQLLDLYEAIKEHCRTHCLWLKKESDLEQYSLECLVGEHYKAWPDFCYQEKLGV